MKTKDPFNIDIVLRHPSYRPEAISKALAIKRQASWAGGQNLDSRRAKWSYFHGCLQKGDSSSEYEGALWRAAQFIEKHAPFWSDFMAGRGEMELVLNHTIPQGTAPGDLCLRLRLGPRFLADLSNRGFGVRLQAWEAGSKPRLSPARQSGALPKARERRSSKKRG